MIKSIFFDFDGTLADSKGAAFKSFVRAMDDMGVIVKKSEAMKHLGERSEVFFKNMGLSPGQIDSAIRRFWKIFRRKAIKEKLVKPCVSLEPLKELKKEVSLFVISNSETSYVKKVLKNFGARKLFGGIYGGDKFGNKEEMIRKLCRKNKLMSHEVVYVGDRFSDIDAARDAGCYAIGINNSCAWSDLKTMKFEKPDFLIKDFYGLKKVVENLNKDYFK